MKNVILLFVFLFLSHLLFGQLTESQRSMAMGSHNALELNLPNTELKFAQKWWGLYLKDHRARAKKVKGSDEQLAIGVGAVSGSSNIYSRFEEVGSSAKGIFWFYQPHEDIFISSRNTESFQDAEKFLLRYALFVSKEKTKIELKEEEKSLSKLSSELIRLERNNANFHKEIEIAREKISAVEKKIEINLEDQEKMKRNISDQNEVVEGVKQRLSEL